MGMSGLERRIDQGAGREPADLVVRNARILNTATGTLDPGDIAICGDRIVGTHDNYRGRREIDVQGRIVAPGFIDTHLHIESSLVLPSEFEQGVLPRGTTTAICDPHEIANVLGVAGIRYFLAASESLAMTLRVNLSSCVPATELETSGARLELADLLPLRTHPAALGLAEVMNFPGVLAKDAGLLAKLDAFADGHVDGHAPLLRGMPLNAYLAAGIRTDHECTLLEEAREKLAKGMIVLMREGSIAKNVTALAPLLTDLTWPRIAFCTDDRNPLEIVEEGHIDAAMRLAIAAGAPPIAVYRSASLGAAMAFGLADRGIAAAGYRADLVVLDDFERVSVAQVICGGRLVEPELFGGRTHPAAVGYGSIRRAPVAPAELAPATRGGDTPVIGARPFSLITDHLIPACRCTGGAQVGRARAARPQRQYRQGLRHRLRAAARRDRLEHWTRQPQPDRRRKFRIRHGRSRQSLDRSAGRGRRRPGRPRPGRSAVAGSRADERPRLRLRRGPSAAAPCSRRRVRLHHDRAAAAAGVPAAAGDPASQAHRPWLRRGRTRWPTAAGVLGGQRVSQCLAARQHDGLHQTAGIVVPDRA